MSHLGPEGMRRILAGKGGPLENEKAVEHITSCEPCRALAGTLAAALRAEGLALAEEGPLRLVFDLIDREHQWGVDSLKALAEWAELRHLPGRRSQRDRVRMSKAYHTIAFFDLLLGEIKETAAWEEAEFLAGLAFLSLEAMSRRQLTPAFSCDLQAEVWTAVANARRRAAEWKRAHQALANAERLLRQGTGDLRREAGRLSIAASTLADEGQVAKALATLERCRSLYESLSEWPLLARTLVKIANTLAETDPARGLLALDRALPLIPAADSQLKIFAEMTRVECLIEAGNPRQALRVFRGCSHLLAGGPKARTRIRATFTSARLLAALGFEAQAERLFDEVVNRDIEHELYKDAFLDLLYLYGIHATSGNLEKAARVCRRALTDSTLSEVAHEQLRVLWTQLLEATQRQAIRPDMLRDLRQFLSLHFKHPAPHPPVVAF